MALLSGFNVTLADVKLMGEASLASFAGGAIPNGWTVVTPASLGVAPAYQDGNYFTNGNASAIVLRQGNSYIVSFRGTDGSGDIDDYPELFFGTYINKFDPLLSALASQTDGSATFSFTGASLGGGATNLMANIAGSSYSGKYANAKFVAFASPNISNASGILNIGAENDPVFKAINGYGDFASSLDNMVLATSEYMAGNYDGQHPFDTYAHSAASVGFDAFNRLALSAFYGLMSPDSVLVLDAYSGTVQDITPGRENTGAFYLGESIADTIVGRNGDDYVEGLGGNDFLYGGIGADSLAGGADSDTLTGGGGGDLFYFDAAALTQANSGVFDRVADYNQGNSGAFSAGEGDRLDFSSILSSAFAGGQSPNSLVRALENPDSGLTFVQIDADGTGGASSWTTIARVDGVHAGHTLSVVLHSSQPAGSQIVAGIGNGLAEGFVECRDFNGDGRDDILWRRENGETRLWEMNGAQTTNNLAVGTVDAAWQIVGLGDLNGNGTSDILWRHTNGTTVLWTMNGGTKVGDVNLNMIPTSWQIQGVNDFDGDGKSDIVWRHTNGTTVLWLMDGGQKKADVNLNAIPTSWHIQGVRDFNNDGKSDILWRHDTGATVLWTMNGTQVAADQNVSSINTAWHVRGTSDFNGDGNSDILWRSDSGQLVLWTMVGAQRTSDTNIAAVGNDWQIEGNGDFNNDGNSDILWRHNSGAQVLWEMNGGQILADLNVSTTGMEWQLSGLRYDLV